MNITNFTFKELVKTDTGLDNMPNDMNVVKNLARLAQFLQSIRNELHLPIIVNSAYRSPEVNAKVGGVSSSYHVKGLAADIRCSDMDKLLTILHSHLMDLASEEDTLLAEAVFVQLDQNLELLT